MGIFGNLFKSKEEIAEEERRTKLAQQKELDLSRPSRFVGRTLLKGAKKLDEKLFGE